MDEVYLLFSLQSSLITLQILKVFKLRRPFSLIEEFVKTYYHLKLLMKIDEYFLILESKESFIDYLDDDVEHNEG